MAVDFNFVKSVLREYTAEERTAISLIAEKECQLDGLNATMDIWNLSNTYVAIYLLAIGDSRTAEVGSLRVSRTLASQLAKQYRGKYTTLLKGASVDYRVEAGDDGVTLPEVYI